MTEKNKDLKEACLKAAREVIAESGLENLSLREVARKLNVSHQAPYRHFQSRDHLLVEVMCRCFREFADNLDARLKSDDPVMDLQTLGYQYLDYAKAHPLEYRLMFGTPWPDVAHSLEMMKDACHAFDILRSVLKRIYGDDISLENYINQQALFIWSTVHGFTSITEAKAMDHLGISPEIVALAPQHVIKMLSLALMAEK
jgi:AcrR family transcriptional regulator